VEKEAVTRRKLYNLLSNLESSPGDYLTLYIKPSFLCHYIDELSLRPEYRAYTAEIKEMVNNKAVIQELERYETGAAIFWQEGRSKYMVLPPFPIRKNKASIGKIDISLLYEILGRKYIIGVVLVTWGSYAIGVFDEHDNLVESKAGTGYIHKEHKKGGSSQKRFARRTEEQKKDFLRKVSNSVEEKFKSYTLDYIFFGGNRLIRKPLLKECICLKSEIYKISGRTLGLRYANRETLNHTLEEITSSLAFRF
jgi:hypothetical protein